MLKTLIFLLKDLSPRSILNCKIRKKKVLYKCLIQKFHSAYVKRWLQTKPLLHQNFFSKSQCWVGSLALVVNHFPSPQPRQSCHKEVQKKKSCDSLTVHLFRKSCLPRLVFLPANYSPLNLTIMSGSCDRCRDKLWTPYANLSLGRAMPSSGITWLFLFWAFLWQHLALLGFFYQVKILIFGMVM